MTAAAKPILPLANPVPEIPVPANDPLPIGTLTMADIRQRLPRGRSKPVAVEVIRPRKVHHIDAAEAAFFPRLLWGVYLAFDQDDVENARIASELRGDMQTYGDLMNPSQWADFKREMDSGAMAAMEIMVDQQIGQGVGGWNAIKVFAVAFLLMLWVDRHAAQAMYTTRFAKIAEEVFAHMQALHGDEFEAVEPSAHKMLPKVIKRLKSCGLFLWLPDYRRVEGC